MSHKKAQKVESIFLAFEPLSHDFHFCVFVLFRG